MPISRQEFDDGRLDLSVPILQFLSLRNGEAFTADEVLDELLNYYGRRVTEAEVVVVLEDLVKADKLESKQIAGAEGYIYKGELY
ncbi:MAG: hypothetical protein F4X66_09180 [Chloroflexi bacterium]|nr:hypothetical protein [Chloroflexota bacterium]MYE38703.1 hypothetical protein [Chloroflexota bacterium]